MRGKNRRNINCHSEVEIKMLSRERKKKERKKRVEGEINEECYYKREEIL